MTTFGMDIPVAQVPRVIAAFVGVYLYQDTIPDPVNPGMYIANPETKAAFTQRKLREHVRDIVRKWEADQASLQAQQTASAKVDSELTIT